MKTTENISLSGYAFTIETDAYAELGTYLNDIKAAFRNDSNADEIVSDIEERIAEILREKCANGMVVDMNMINDIKQRIGNPKDLAQDDSSPVTEEANTETPDPKRSWKTKRLYRDVENKVFGGVCSGLGAYFGFDKVLLRIALILIFVILFIGSFDESEPFFFIPVIAYLGLWIAMPAARTDEQKRELATLKAEQKAQDIKYDALVRESAGLSARAKAMATGKELQQIREREDYGAKIIDVSRGCFVAELTGDPSLIDDFLDAVKPFEMIEMCRTGATALERGKVSYDID